MMRIRTNQKNRVLEAKKAEFTKFALFLIYGIMKIPITMMCTFFYPCEYIWKKIAVTMTRTFEEKKVALIVVDNDDQEQRYQ